MASTYLPMTEEAREFFASNHKADHAKGYIALSPDLAKANDTLWRRKWPLQLRKRVLATFKDCVNNPHMTGIEMSDFDYKFDWKEQLLHVEDKTLEEIIKGG